MIEKKYLLSVDPGLSTGIALFSYSDAKPANLEAAWQFRGGLVGFLQWCDSQSDVCNLPNKTTIAEKFTARPGVGFAHTTDALEPLRIEGAMIALGMIDDYHPGGKNPQWMTPTLQYFAGGKDKAEKKIRQHRWLREKNSLYVTGKMVNAPDADDVRSAMAHGIAWFRRQKHMPTLREYFKED